MNLFIQDLKNEINPNKPWGDGLNPLIILGLTEAILDLGLPEEDLHICVSSYARQLSGRVHPDRPSLASPERQREIIAAFDTLKEFAIFAHCLKDLRSIRSWDRREIRILRENITNLRQGQSHLPKAYRDFESYKVDMMADIQQQRQEYSKENENSRKNLQQQVDHLEDYKSRFRTKVLNSFNRREKWIQVQSDKLNEYIADAVRKISTRTWSVELAKFKARQAAKDRASTL